jgi:hypothetical protein
MMERRGFLKLISLFAAGVSALPFLPKKAAAEALVGEIGEWKGITVHCGFTPEVVVIGREIPRDFHIFLHPEQYRALQQAGIGPLNNIIITGRLPEEYFDDADGRRTDGGAAGVAIGAEYICHGVGKRLFLQGVDMRQRILFCVSGV